MTSEQQSLVEDLFAAYSRGVGSFVLARVGDADVAEEVVSRVFVRVTGAIAQCRGAPAAWLWAIVRNELAMHFRGLRSHLGVRPLDTLDGFAALEHGLVSSCEPPEARAESAETRSQLARALSRLSEESQQLVWMKFYQDMGNTEIAEATGMKPGHIGVLLHRAIKQLRAELVEAPESPMAQSAMMRRNPELSAVGAEGGA